MDVKKGKFLLGGIIALRGVHFFIPSPTPKLKKKIRRNLIRGNLLVIGMK